ncbi:MAG TPA: diguanylate cyclase, partial [Oxalicibacterium sp.]|nr:diguanylate cyclase [Oxalicibacterium sp.]
MNTLKKIFGPLSRGHVPVSNHPDTQGAISAAFAARHLHIVLGWPLLSVVLGALLWIGIVSELDSEKASLEKEAMMDVASLSSSYAEYLTRTIERIDQLTLQLRYDWTHANGKYRLENLQRGNVFSFPHSAAVTIVDRDGVPVTSTFPLRQNISWQDTDAFQYHASNPSDELRIGTPMHGKISGQTIIRMTRRINDAEGRFAGMIVASVAPEYFFSTANSPMLGQDGFQALAGQDGVVHAVRENDGITWNDSPLFRMPPSGTTATLLPGKRWFRDGKSRYVAAQPLDSYPFLAVVGMEQDAALAHYTAHSKTMRAAGIAGTVFLLLFTVIAVVLSLRLAWKTHRLEAVRNTYRIATEFGNDGYYMWRPVADATGNVVDFEIVDCNERGASLLGITKTMLLQTHLSGVAALQPGLVALMRHSGLALERGYQEDDIELTGPLGERQAWLHMRMARSEDGLAVTLRDISDQKEHERELSRLATSDTLTGLPNRHWLMQHLPASMAIAAEKQQSLAVLFIDMDDFKNINDTLGHSAGDRLLQTAARRLQSALRPGDSVARLGGDEFTLIVPSISRQDDVSSIAQRVMATFAEPFEIQNRLLNVNVSIGVSMFPADGRDAETLLKNADIAMYAAKADGKNTHRFYDNTLYDEIEKRLDNERQLARALREDHFVVYYQPRVDTHDGTLVGMEALVRWMHPERGLIPPDRFIPLAEETGMIVELGKLVLQKVCAQIVRWEAE